ncbi:MAG: fumarate/nitrate reduction transcriptional regulator Fnr [Proteobacteria bacterium]|nr:MAG: fumarate/nitrate reduction transcriptional regulator Fnr [Pseudomonadota bacterium]
MPTLHLGNHRCTVTNLINIDSVKLSCKNCSLSELCLPRSLSPEDLARFEEIVTQRPPIPKGGALYRSGEPSHALYAIKSGALKSIVTTEDGEEQIVGFHMPGELVGFDGVESVHNCTVVSLERSSVCELPLKDLEFLSQKISSLHREVCTVMRREISQEQSMLLLLARRTAESRLASFLVSLSRRLGSRGFSQTDFNLVMSRHDIANYLGLAAETVSRLISKFQEAGILSVNRRRVVIRDLDALNGKVGTCSSAKSA